MTGTHADPARTADEEAELASLGYRDAVEELEAILTAIEDDAVDIDQLARQVRRAAALIRLCQDRIAGARIEVERVVADLALGPMVTDRPDDDMDDDKDDDIDDDPGSDLDVENRS